jgi:hypothetical protein
MIGRCGRWGGVGWVGGWTAETALSEGGLDAAWRDALARQRARSRDCARAHFRAATGRLAAALSDCVFSVVSLSPILSLSLITCVRLDFSSSGVLLPRPTGQMALVTLTDVQVLNNPAGFSDPYQFEITFECIKELQDGVCVCVSVCSLPSLFLSFSLISPFLSLSLSLPSHSLSALSLSPLRSPFSTLSSLLSSLTPKPATYHHTQTSSGS